MLFLIYSIITVIKFTELNQEKEKLQTKQRFLEKQILLL